MSKPAIEKAMLGSVRLDSDIWAAVRAMPESLNKYLRRNLLDGESQLPSGSVGAERLKSIPFASDAKGTTWRAGRKPIPKPSPRK